MSRMCVPMNSIRLSSARGEKDLQEVRSALCTPRMVLHGFEKEGPGDSFRCHEQKKRGRSMCCNPLIFFGGSPRNRTLNLRIKSPLLCQLS